MGAQTKPYASKLLDICEELLHDGLVATKACLIQRCPAMQGIGLVRVYVWVREELLHGGLDQRAAVLAASAGCRIWFGYVESSANVADGPSRHLASWRFDALAAQCMCEFTAANLPDLRDVFSAPVQANNTRFDVSRKLVGGV